MAAHRYWRLFSIYNNGYAYTNVCELEMFTSLGGPNVCTGGTAFSSSDYPGWEAAKAFDGVKTGDQGWSTLSSGTQANQWVGYDFGAGSDVEIEQVAITARTNATGLGGQPRFFAIEWSDDGITWTQKGYIPPQTSWGANETRTFDIVNELSAEMSAVSLASRSFAHRVNRPASFKKSTTGGDGSLGGTVLESSTPVEGAIITVFDETTHAVAGQGTTNIIGDWVIDNLNPNKTYFAVAKHPDDLWEMKISSRRKPSRVNLTIKPSVRLGEHSSAFLTADAATDPHWANVVSLLHFDGADGSTTFTDETGRVWSAYGDAQIDTEQSKFGGAAGLFDGAGDYISTPSHADFNFGSGDFTVEGWARTNGAIAATSCFVGQWSYGDYKFTVGCATSERAYFSLSVSGHSGTELVSANGAIPTSTWFHFAGVRSGSTHTMYVNGVSVATGAISGALFSSTSTICIGSNGNNQAFDGHIEELRITKGVARYTANFTPPTAPFPDS